MRSRFVLVAVAGAFALAACGHKASRPSQCTAVLADPLHAVATLSAKFANDPVKVATIIEDCVAPTGETCDRVARVMTTVPSMVGTDGLVLPDSMSLCDTMPPELQQCLLPSYVLAHKADCAQRQASWRGTASAAADAAVACPETHIYLDDDQLAYGRETKIALPPLKESILDFDGLASGLERLAGTCLGKVTIVASPTMMYQDIITAMDLAVQAGFTDVALDTGEPSTPAPPPPTTKPALTQSPVLVITRTDVMLDDQVIAHPQDADVTTAVHDALAAVRADRRGAELILQADDTTSAKTIRQTVIGAHRAGFADVLFAVKNP